MPKFTVRVKWEMVSYEEVEAGSREEAIEKLQNMDGLPDGDYLDDSFVVTHCSQPDADLVGESEDVV